MNVVTSFKTDHLDPEGILGAARDVLQIESRALDALTATIGHEFTAAIQVLAEASGHVVVTGMGKSGHVARKIAATLASTGTPSFFVHPGEASHGDLGMITSASVVLALSNSGETAELSDLMVFARRYRLPLIAMTGRKNSTLARQADVALVLPSIEEACPLGLAPTTSTTMMLALGDALAVALLRKKGFTREDFHAFHPGGRLGSVLRRVQDIMHAGESMPLAKTGTKMSEVLIEMSGRGFGCIGIVDAEGLLVGIVTDGDLRRHMSPEMLDMPVEHVMTAQPRTIKDTALAAEALSEMNTYNISCLFAVNDGRPTGFVHLHDCLRAGIY